MRAYLDYAGAGPVREPARQAMRSAIDDQLPLGTAGVPVLQRQLRRARFSAARLLTCDPDEISMIPNTSTGVHLVADGLEWRAGDEIVLFHGDFPANIRPWQRLEQRDGVVLKWIQSRAGRYDLDDIERALTNRTRLIACSHVNFATGHRLDLAAICALAHANGSLVFVDAAQSLGMLPISMTDTPVDFLAAGGYKWLCGPAGTGIFFGRRDRLDLLRWAPHGWWGYEGAGKPLMDEEISGWYDLRPNPTARRFESGMYNLLGIAGLAAALDELIEVGIESVARRVRELRGRLEAELGDFTVIRQTAVDWSGIVSIRWPQPERIAETLAEKGCQISCVGGRLRISTHYWTTDAELALLLDLLTGINHQVNP